jgi:uncharacterized protein YdhG (YjbR/CyaY superfamily)
MWRSEEIAMISKAASVKDYISEVPEDRRAAITKLRALCKKNLVGFEESLEYGMPCYKRDGVMAFAFASQKGYISIYGCGSPAVKDLRAKLAGSSKGKGCVRFTNPAKIDFDVVDQLLRRIAKIK